MPLLSLLRHAKSCWADESTADHDRPLNDRGLRDADAAATLLRAGEPVSHVLCSSALRTRQTLDRLVRGGVIDAPRARIEPALYLAELDAMSSLIEAAALEAGHLLVIGHNPGIESLAGRLAGRPIFMKTASLCRFERTDAAAGAPPASPRAWRLVEQLTPRG